MCVNSYVSFEVQLVGQRQRRMRAGGVRGSCVARRSRALSSWRMSGCACAFACTGEAEAFGVGEATGEAICGAMLVVAVEVAVEVAVAVAGVDVVVEGSGPRSASSRVLANAFVRHTRERTGRRRRSTPAHTVNSSESLSSSLRSCEITERLQQRYECLNEYTVF